MSANPPAPETRDGRRQRSEVSRERIVAAMLELVSEGDVTPSAEAVAVRAGVGLRTVFRHFENMESLYQQLNALISAQVLPLAQRPFQSSDWREQLKEMVERRATIFERIMPIKVAADIHRHRSPYLAGQTAQMVREQRAAIAAVLPERLRDDPTVVDSLDLLLSFDAWRRLRLDQGLNRH